MMGPSLLIYWQFPPPHLEQTAFTQCLFSLLPLGLYICLPFHLECPCHPSITGELLSILQNPCHISYLHAFTSPWAPNTVHHSLFYAISVLYTCFYWTAHHHNFFIYFNLYFTVSYLKAEAMSLHPQHVTVACTQYILNKCLVSG